jgi:hypothetical protein
MVLVLRPVIGIGNLQISGIESEERVVCKEEWTSVSIAQRQIIAKIGIAVTYLAVSGPVPDDTTDAGMACVGEQAARK